MILKKNYLKFSQAVFVLSTRTSSSKDRYGKEAGEMTVCKLIKKDANTDLRVKGYWTAPWEVKHSSEEI